MEHLTETELQAWIDRELDPAEHGRVSRHLEACGTCRRVVAELRSASETFSAAMLRYDEGLLAGRDDPAAAPPAFGRSASGRHALGLTRRLPRWVSRAAAVVLLLGAAAAAAMVPGSPLRELIVGPPIEPEPAPPAEVRRAPTLAAPGASITVRPRDGSLLVRITGFASGTRIVVGLVDRAEAVASLPDGAPDARFVVASGTLDVVGAGVAAEELEGPVEVRLPRSLRSGVVELEGAAVARVRDGRLVTLRHISRSGDEAVFEAGG